MSAAEALGLPPGVRFDPTGDELVEFYLLPRALGLPPAVPGIIIEDDDTTATTTSAQHPSKLLARHRRTDDSEAYFFERVAGTSDATTKGGAGGRQDRSCGSSWTWVGQKRAPDQALPLRGDGDGEHVSWSKYSLNLQEGRGRKSGSTGWVLHEYTVASPQGPLLPVKLCHVSFTSHGKKRQRVPDDDGEGEGQELEPQATQPQHKRAATRPCMVARATAMPDQELSEARAQNQEQQIPNYNYDSSPNGHFWRSDAGFSQESSVIMDPSCPDAQSNNQEPFALDQELTQIQQCSASQLQAYNQEQFMFMNPAGSLTEAHCAVQSASDLGSSQEPLAWNPLTEEQQFSLAQLLGAISSPRCLPTTSAAYDEQQQIRSFAPAAMADLPLSTAEQESCTTEQSHGNMDHEDFFRGWGDINSFCDMSGIQDDNDDMAAQMLAADGCRGGMSWDRHFFNQQPAL